MQPSRRRLALGLIAAATVLAVGLPVLAATPAPANSPGRAKPDRPAKGPEVSVSVSGPIRQATDADGNPSFTLTASGKTWQLSVGPAWFWGRKNPLNAFVGKSVAVVGTTRDGETELEVETIDGSPIREAGKPPWAGGPWVVGEIHPGWKPWMADGKPGNGHGRDTAPGQAKDKSAGDDPPDD